MVITNIYGRLFVPSCSGNNDRLKPTLVDGNSGFSRLVSSSDSDNNRHLGKEEGK